MVRFSVIAKVFIAVLVYFMFIDDGIKNARDQLAKKDWIAGDGKVEEVLITTKEFNVSKKYITTSVRYSYKVEGKKYERTDVLLLDEIHPASTDEMNVKVIKEKKYPPGSIMSIRINPLNAYQATFLEASGNYRYQLGFGVVAEVILILLIIKDFRNKVE